jgi:RimJ/RimL family protein N-acetyltransferase
MVHKKEDSLTLNILAGIAHFLQEIGIHLKLFGGVSMLTRNLLIGDNIRLTSITEEDMPTVTTWYQDGDFLRLLDAVPAMPRSQEELKKEFLGEPSHNTFRFAIRKADESAIIGIIQLQSILWNHGVSWVAIEVGQEHQGRGYGQEAMKLCLNYAFRELNLHRVQLSVFSYNEPAIRAYEKIGFKHEGTYREFLYRDGKRYDMLLYSILRPEWESLQNL